MNTTSICRKLLTILPLTCALGAFPAWGEDNGGGAVLACVESYHVYCVEDEP